MNPNITRRQALIYASASLGAGTSALPWAAHAQGWPERPIRIVVPFAAGAGTDAVGRLMAQKMGAEPDDKSERTFKSLDGKRTIKVVDNKSRSRNTETPI